VKASKKLLPVREAYLVFSKEKNPELIKLNPKISKTDLMQQVGSSWMSLSDEEKNVSLFCFVSTSYFCL